ncbi:DMT family transporter [Actibacterium ureilyticum]|uniref:DMT family transporter n=1 Tax=Actibacterium ureilyticum TaxID=1590614 RepID=UPI000BAAFDF5|nr:DMT family transporter [Actibacterium ureilyticum]
MRTGYWIAIFALGMGWGASFFLNEILLRELGPMMIALGRVGLGALGCWLWLFAAGRAGGMPRGTLRVLILFALAQYAIPLTVFPVMQQHITSSAAGIINAMTPIMVVLVSHFWPGGERATPLRVLGVILGFAGIVLLVSPAFRGQGGSAPWALLATMVAPLCYGFALNILRRLDAMDRTLLTAWSLTLGTVAVAPVALAMEGVPRIARAETWAALLVIGFVLTSAAFILLFWLIPRVGGTVASTVTFLTPVSAVLLGVLVLDELLAPVQLLGMAVIFAGLVAIDGRLLRWLGDRQPNG